MKLYIVRHGQTKWNAQMRMQGWENSDLTVEGKAQAKLLGAALKDIDFKKVYTSPLGRAVETTNHIIGDRNLNMEVNEYFKEMSFGSWEGQSPEYLKEHHKEQFKNFWNYAHKYKPTANGETYEDISKRVKEGIDEIISLNCNKNDNILLVTHGMIIQMLILHTKGLPLDRLWDRQVVNSSSLTIIEINNKGEMNLLIEDNIDHLN